MKKKKQPKFLASFSSDRLVFGFCIGLAFISWLLVKLSEDFITTQQVKIEYLLPENRSFVETPPSSIMATVKGSGWNLLFNYLNQDEVLISFSLPEKPSFTISGNILKNKIEHELSLDILKIDLDHILLNMDGLEQKRVPPFD